MMFFAHLMTAEQVLALLTHRAEQLADVVKELNQAAAHNTEQPAGVEFVRGFGETITRAALDYINDYKHLLDEQAPKRLAS